MQPLAHIYGGTIMVLTGCHFTYAGVSSSTFIHRTDGDIGLRFVNMDTERYISLTGENTTSSAYSRRGNKLYYLGDSWEDGAVTFEAEIMTDDEVPMTAAEIQSVSRWLFNRPGYLKLTAEPSEDCDDDPSYSTIDDTVKKYYYNCRMIKPRRIEGNGGVVGFAFTIECDSNMLWQEAIEKTLTPETVEGVKQVSINIDSDGYDYIYPKVTIGVGTGGGNITIQNATDDASLVAPRLTGFAGLSGGASIVMNSMNSTLSNDAYSKFNYKNFIRLLPGRTNTFTVTGDVASLKFEWSNRKYI